MSLYGSNKWSWLELSLGPFLGTRSSDVAGGGRPILNPKVIPEVAFPSNKHLVCLR